MQYTIEVDFDTYYRLKNNKQLFLMFRGEAKKEIGDHLTIKYNTEYPLQRRISYIEEIKVGKGSVYVCSLEVALESRSTIPFTARGGSFHSKV